MLDYAAIQRETVERLASFNAASTDEVVVARLREVANRTAVFAAQDKRFVRAGTAGPGPVNAMTDRS